MTETPRIGTVWLLLAFLLGIFAGVCFLGPHIIPRYEIHTHSIMIMKLDTWTGRTWTMSEGKWNEHFNKE